MSEGYVQKGIEAISDILPSRVNLTVDAQHIDVSLPRSAPRSTNEVVNLGDNQIRKISPYETSEPFKNNSPQYSVSGTTDSGSPAFRQMFERLTSMFGSSKPMKPQSLVSFSSLESNTTSIESGEGSKTPHALIEFKEAQKVSVAFGLLSALTQSVLSSVKRLTQGQ